MEGEIRLQPRNPASSYKREGHGRHEETRRRTSQQEGGEASGSPVAELGRRAQARRARGSLNMRHGIRANRFLSEDEKSLFDAIIAQLYQDFVFNKNSDLMQVELVAA